VGNAMARADPIDEAVGGATTYHGAVAGAWGPGAMKDIVSNLEAMASPMNKPSLLKVETNAMDKAGVKAVGNAMARADPIDEAVGGAATYHGAVAGAWGPGAMKVALKARTGNLAGIAASGPNKDHSPSITGLGTTTTTQPSLTIHPTAKKVAFQETFHWTQPSKSKALVTSAICGFGKKIAKGMIVGTVLSHLAFKGSFVSAVSVDKFDAKDELDPNSVGIRTSQSTGEIRMKTFKEKRGTYLRTDSELDETPKNVNGVSVFPHVDEAWEAEMAQALRNLDDEIEIVRQARELREANEDKDEDEDEDDEDVDDEDELEAIENSEEKSFLGNEGHGLVKTVINNCTSISVIFRSMNEMNSSINFGSCPGYAPADEAPVCDQDLSKEEEIDFPVTCTFRMEFHGDPGAQELIVNDQGKETDMEEMLSTGKRRGKRTKQYEWASKAAKRMSYGEAEGSCTPKHHGRDVRGMECDLCKWGWVPHPCNCNCRGWEQKTVDCWKPCSHYNDEYTQTIGYHCWKPCDREGQLALNVGCGYGPLDRTCHASDGDCVMKYVNHAISLIDVLTTVLSGGVAGAFKAAVKTAVKAGTKVAAKQGIKAAIKKAAKEFAKSLMNSKAIQKKVNKFKRQFRKDLKNEVYEQGSELFIAASSSNSEQEGPDALEILDEVVEAVDPTGIYGMVKGWIPPDYCDDTVYLDEDIPDEENGLPDIGALDGMTKP